MGRITIFALVDCPHCQRTKNALKEREIPYTEISLTSHPAKRTDMLSLADRLTVPQVFFNEKHIGGADDTMKILQRWDDDETQSALEHFQGEVASQPDPADPRLQVPTTPPEVESPPPPRPDENSILLPDGVTKTTVTEVTEMLKVILPLADLRYNVTLYRNAIRGSDVVKALWKNAKIVPLLSGIDRKGDAAVFSRMLKQRRVIVHVVDNHIHDLEDIDNLFYRLQCHQQPSILNSYRIWTERVDTDNPMGLLKRLKKLLGKVESAVTNSKGQVDYRNAHEDPNYPIFEEAVCELQGINVGKMDEPTKLAFGINLYNLMIKYAFMKVGIGTTTTTRGAFFGNVQMNVGGDIFTFNELENGILRSNRKPPYSFSVPFGPKDPRLRLVSKEADCRIHFALNCGATSCPPVKNFTAESIDEELRIVAMAFCEQDDNVRVDPERMALHLSKILSWYRVDFAPSNEKLPEKVVAFLRGDKKEALQKMIDSGKSIAIKFNDYDWGTNASDFVPFERIILTSSEKTLVKGLF